MFLNGQLPCKSVDIPDVKKMVERIFDFIKRESDIGGWNFSVSSKHNEGAIINEIATLLPKQVFYGFQNILIFLKSSAETIIPKFGIKTVPKNVAMPREGTGQYLDDHLFHIVACCCVI